MAMQRLSLVMAAAVLLLLTGCTDSGSSAGASPETSAETPSEPSTPSACEPVELGPVTVEATLIPDDPENPAVIITSLSAADGVEDADGGHRVSSCSRTVLVLSVPSGMVTLNPVIDRQQVTANGRHVSIDLENQAAGHGGTPSGDVSAPSGWYITYVNALPGTYAWSSAVQWVTVDGKPAWGHVNVALTIS
ncbi:hypothetical protein GTQ99_16525 [Kineococcus sp. T13]|uniref:hypothetical protein n=1 Tax=Kineococcus vitellinus TaxID=2696565 RepID=UPI001412B2C1|nr:hypothetical protein [Kineococcus vitellinus]NAZ77015.1 hypothetical protein [Kineococcus vitellinus]